jgi:hypothetical protein
LGAIGGLGGKLGDNGERPCTEEIDYTSQIRAGLVTYWLCHGEALTTTQVAELTGLTYNGAWKMMCVLSGRLPFYQTDDGEWQVTALKELEGIV